jgi:hypothetical protein
MASETFNATRPASGYQPVECRGPNSTREPPPNTGMPTAAMAISAEAEVASASGARDQDGDEAGRADKTDGDEPYLAGTVPRDAATPLGKVRSGTPITPTSDVRRKMN